MPGLPSPRPPRVPTGARRAVDEWRAFGDGRYRSYHGIGIGSAAVFALAGDGLTIPLLLALGAPAALATFIGVLPFTFSAAQLLVPSLLRRTEGNLRGVTLAILIMGETRGFLLATIVLLHVAGLVPAPLAIFGVAAVMCLGGAASSIGGANLLAWYGAILSDPERRFVAPRVMGITQGLGALLLLPVALGVEVGLGSIGLAVYAAVFLASALAGLGELVAVTRLRRPGRVRVAAHRDRPPLSPETRSFIRIVALAAAGAGFGPYLSIFAISVLGQTAGYAILLSAVSAGAALITATLVGGLLGRGSASRTLRLSFILRGGGILLALLAFPGNPAAWLLLLLVAALVSAGSSAAILAANERLLRLTGGVDLIHAQSRFVAGSAAGVTVGQLASAGILATLPVSFATFAILMTGSGLTRLILATRIQVSTTWSTATASFDVTDLRGTARPPETGLPGVPPPEPGQTTVPRPEAGPPAPASPVEPAADATPDERP